MAASSSEIQLRADEICVRGKLGKICQYEYDFLWMGPLDRSEEAVRDAAQRLSDPLRRMREELGWFWVWGQADQEALARLGKNDRAGAYRIWKSQQESNGESSLIAKYNQAILAHSSVIGEELLLQDEMGSLLQLESDESHWENLELALRNWADLIKDERFWALFQCIVRGRDDARLTESALDELRKESLLEIIQPSLIFLEQAIRDRAFGSIRRHAEVLKKSGIPSELLRPCFQKNLELYATGIHQACEDATRALNQKLPSGLAPSEVLRICLDIYGVLKKQASIALELGELLDPKGQTEFQMERDRYGETLRKIGISMANEGKAYSDALRLTEEAIKWSVSASAHVQLKADKEILEGLIRDTEGEQDQQNSDPRNEEKVAGNKTEAPRTREEAVAAWRADPKDKRTWGQVVGDWEKEATHARGERVTSAKQETKTRPGSAAIEQTAMDVKLNSKGQYSYHRVCSCCLTPTEHTESISGSRTEYRVIGNVQHTLKVSLPLCKECKAHTDRENGRKGIWLFSTAVSIILAYWIGSSIPGANWIVALSLFFLGDGVTALCLNKWMPRREPVVPHVSRSMPAQMHSFEEGSFVIRFLNGRFGKLFAQANRPIVLSETAIKIPHSFIDTAGLFNEKHGRITTIGAGISLVIGLALIPSGYYESTKTQSLPVRSDAAEKDALEMEEAALTRLQAELKADTNRLQNMRQRMDILSDRINQIDGSYSSGYMPYEAQAEREQLVAEHNGLVDTVNALGQDALQRANNFEARRLSFNTRVDEYNRRIRGQ